MIIFHADSFEDDYNVFKNTNGDLGDCTSLTLIDWYKNYIKYGPQPIKVVPDVY